MNKFLQSVRQSAKLMSLLIKTRTVEQPLTPFLFTDPLKNNLSSNASIETPQEGELHTVDNDQGKVDKEFEREQHKRFIKYMEECELKRVRKEEANKVQNPRINNTSNKWGRG